MLHKVSPLLTTYVPPPVGTGVEAGGGDVGAGVGGIEPPAGMVKRWPTKIRLGLVIPFAAMIADWLMPKRIEMRKRVSPRSTMYMPPDGAGAGEGEVGAGVGPVVVPGIVKRCPAKMRLAFV